MSKSCHFSAYSAGVWIFMKYNVLMYVSYSSSKLACVGTYPARLWQIVNFCKTDFANFWEFKPVGVVLIVWIYKLRDLQFRQFPRDFSNYFPNNWKNRQNQHIPSANFFQFSFKGILKFQFNFFCNPNFARWLTRDASPSAQPTCRAARGLPRAAPVLEGASVGH